MTDWIVLVMSSIQYSVSDIVPHGGGVYSFGYSCNHHAMIMFLVGSLALFP